MKKIFPLFLTLVAAASQAPAAFASATTDSRSFTLGSASSNDLMSLFNARVAASPAAATRADIPEVITNPEGELTVYARHGMSCTMDYDGNLIKEKTNGLYLNVITSPDGETVYFNDIMSYALAFSYVKGSKTGDEITVPMGQYILYSEAANYGLLVAAGKYVEATEEESASFVYAPEVEDVKFKVNADGSMQIDSRFCSEGDNLPEYELCMFWSDDMSWATYADWNSCYTLFTDEPQTLPDNIEISDWVLNWTNLNPDWDETVANFMEVKAGIKDDSFYIQGLNAESPDCVATGVIADGKVTFAADQYLGLREGFFTYLGAASYAMPSTVEAADPVLTATKEIVFNYDATTNTLSPAVENSALILNGGTEAEALNPQLLLADPTLFKFVDKPAIPATPEIIYFEDAFEEDGFIGLRGVIPTADTEGNYISPSKMKYILWLQLDGDEYEYEFYADEYPSIADLGVESLIEIPYDMLCDADPYYAIMPGAEQVLLYCAAPDAVGLQSVYYGGGERNVSEIAWNYSSGVKDAVATEATPAAFYGIDGTRHNSLQKGINIVKMSDGSVKKIMK